MADVVDWQSLGLTRQQADIMQVIAASRARGLRCTPSELQRNYEKLTGRAIQKPNFFSQLKALVGISFLAKEGGEYFPNIAAVEKSLSSRRKVLEAETEKLESQSKNFRKLINSSSLDKALPLVQYQSIESYFGHLAEQTVGSEVFCSNSVFPWVCFSIIIASASGSMEYYNKVRELCGKKGVEIRYISSFNTRYIAGLALKATHNDSRMALQECLKSLNNLRSLLKIFPNLHIRYVPGGLNFHFVVMKPRGDEPHSLYLFIFGDNGDIQNGIIINSPKMAEDTYKMFNEEFAKAVDMRSPKAEFVYKKLEKEFRRLLRA